MFKAELWACDQSSMTLVSHTDNGATHDYVVQLCIGGGILGSSRGADFNTTNFGLAMYKHGATINISNYTASLTSTETAVTNIASIEGPQPQSPFFCENFLYFQQPGATPFICVTSTAQCGIIHSDCFNISFTTDVKLDSIMALAIEGGGNPNLGCHNEGEMLIDFAALPVELSEFKGKQNDEGVYLEWQTLSELNNDYFEVERSTNFNDFKTLGIIQGKGTTSTANDYFYQDAPIFAGTYYYRLRQIDFDGSYSYSNIIAVEFEKDQTHFKVFPNPTRLLLNIELGQNADAIIEIFDQYGQLAQRFSSKNKATVQLDIRQLEKGIYFIRVQAGDKVFKERFMKY
jgi:hypothetical protein